MFGKILAMMGKLGPVVQKIDFYSSESSVTTYDQKGSVRIEKVVTYKPQKADGRRTVKATPQN